MGNKIDFLDVIFCLFSAAIVVVLMYGCYKGGYEKGTEDAYPVAFDNGYNSGYENGYEEGYSVGYDKGYSDVPVVEEEEDNATINVSYDWDRVVRVVTQEAGTDINLCYAVAQCIANGCADTLLNPEELIDKYGYTFPSTWISDAAEEACEHILLMGETYLPVGDADVFYSTSADFYSSWHEKQEFITQIGCVRFFRMR